MKSECVRVSPAVRVSVSADGLVLLDVQGGVVLASNAIGARIWSLIEQRQTETEIAHQLVQDYEVPLERAEQDVSAFVVALVGRGLAVVDSSC